MRLRNLLKLPKAHKWVCYEWFYSNIDKWVNGRGLSLSASSPTKPQMTHLAGNYPCESSNVRITALRGSRRPSLYKWLGSCNHCNLSCFLCCNSFEHCNIAIATAVKTMLKHCGRVFGWNLNLYSQSFLKLNEWTLIC
jgi:hypothetical protein